MMNLVALIGIIAVHRVAALKLDVSTGYEKPENCNCIQTSLAPMPSDAKTCLQSSFIDGLTEKLTANVLRIQKELNGKDCDCNFGNVETALQKISAKIKKIIKILSACDPNEDMLNAAIDRYEELKREYNSAIRRATASQSSKCGSILAKIRPILLNCAENIMAAVLKCLNFRRS